MGPHLSQPACRSFSHQLLPSVVPCSNLSTCRPKYGHLACLLRDEGVANDVKPRQADPRNGSKMNGNVRLIYQEPRGTQRGFLTDQADPRRLEGVDSGAQDLAGDDPEDFAPPAPCGQEELRAYPLGTFCFSQSARNFFKPMSVRGCWTSCLKTANGMVQMSPPILAASTTCRGWRTLATSTFVLKW